jgi:hypothetical protein
MNIYEELNALLTKSLSSTGLPETFEVFESGNWIAEDDTESKIDIIKHLPSGRFFKCFFSRCGSDYQGYETVFDRSREVEPYEATVILWRTK